MPRTRSQSIPRHDAHTRKSYVLSMESRQLVWWGGQAIECHMLEEALFDQDDGDVAKDDAMPFLTAEPLFFFRLLDSPTPRRPTDAEGAASIGPAS